MPFVIFFATMTTACLWALPSFMERRSDVFSWRTALRGQAASLWWAAASIAAFGGVMIGGHAFGGLGAAVSGLAIDGAFAWKFHQTFGNTRKLQSLCAALGAGPAAATTLDALEAELRRHREMCEGRVKGYETWARWTLHAAAQAFLAGHTVTALRWTGSMDPVRLGPGLSGSYIQHVASFRIAVGDRTGARALLAGASRPAEPAAMEEGLQALEALLEALEGDAVAALRFADAALAVPASRGTVNIIWMAARAHALEALGAAGDARAVLHAIRTDPRRRIPEAHRAPRWAGLAGGRGHARVASSLPVTPF